jgi:anti-sigma factor RsiW
VLLFRDMNPDKLFDYRDGKLPDHERQAMEER